VASPDRRQDEVLFYDEWAGIASRTRGTLYMSRERRAVWRRVLDIAHEGRDEREALELIGTATRMALEHHGMLREVS
jgi:hypothetical protein